MSITTPSSKLLETLFQNRWHGAVTLERFQFQILYSLYRAFELLDSQPKWSIIQFEGIEDVDLRTASGDVEYVQVKSSAKAQYWSWLANENIIGKFFDIYRAEPRAQFRLVVDFDFRSDLQEFEQYLGNQQSQLPTTLHQHLDAIAKNCNCSIEDIIELCTHLTIERIDKRTLISKISQAIIEKLDVYTGNENLYFLTLLSRTYEFAMHRKEITSNDLHATKIEIDEWINAGEQNPAINQGWIAKLLFEDKSKSNRYYEGKGAQPSDISGRLDVYREDWIQKVHQELQLHQVCVVRGSSGQGKSTLLFRYAYDFYDSHTVLIIRDLKDDSRIEPIKRYIEALLKLNLPVLVLINDLMERTKEWHELVRQLTGKSVSFLIATRHENWFRYSSGLADIDWSTVLPEMSFEEAQQIFNQFQQEGRIAPNVSSAAWAYAQVSEKKLLIEFVFLITQGQMLSERLEGQIKTIHDLQEDKAKLQILRLVSLAQVLDISLTWESVTTDIDTTNDMQQLLRSMQDEYIIISPDGTIEGLHFVRSNHLVSILHDGYPVSRTIQVLLKHIADDSLAEAAYLIYVNPKLETSYSNTILLLIERAKNDIDLTISITQSLFRADEHRYIRGNQEIIDKFISEFDLAALSIFFINATVPIAQIDTFALMQNHIPEVTLDHMKTFVKQMPGRSIHETRFAEKFLSATIKELSEINLAENLALVATLNLWMTHLNIGTEIIDQFIKSGLWHGELFSHPVSNSASFMQLLHEKYPLVYEEVWSENDTEIKQHFLRSTNTLTISQKASDIRIEFIVDEATKGNQQAVERLELLRQWIPHFETYSSQGLYPTVPIAQLKVDETKKSIPKDHLSKPENIINRQYIEEIKSLYNTQLIYDYLAFWHEFRSISLNFVEMLTDHFERLIARKAGPNIQSQAEQLRPLTKDSPNLPDYYLSIFKPDHEKLTSLQKDINYFLAAFLPNINSKDPEDTRRYRLHLFSAQNRLRDAQQAFTRVRYADGVFFDLTIDDVKELDAYRRLYETVECWLETPNNHALSKGVKARDYVKLQTRQRNQSFQAKLQAALTSLQYYSPMIQLPESYLEEPPLYNLVIGSEICFFPLGGLQGAFGAALKMLSNLKLNYHYAYIIPLLNNQPVFGFAYKLHKDTVLKSASGEPPSDKIEVFQVAISKAMFDTIPSIEETAIPETALYLSAQGLIGQLKGLRNEFFLATLHLKDSMPDYLEDIRSRIVAKLDQILDSKNELLKQRSSISTAPASEEWAQIWEHFVAEIGEKEATVLEIESYSAEPIADDLELSRLFNDYLIRRYC